MIANIRRLILYALFLTVGTYAVPELRVADVPYTVPIAGLLVVWMALEHVLGRPFHVPNWLLVPSLLYVVSVFASTLFAAVPDWPLTFKYAAFGLIPLVVSVAIRNPDTVRGCMICLMVSSFGVLLYGIYGYVTGNVGDPIEHGFGYFGVTYLRATRNSDQLYFLVPFCVCAAVLLQGRVRLRWWRSLAIVGCLLVLTAVLILSYVRGAWVVMAIVSALWLRRLHVADRSHFAWRAAALVAVLGFAVTVWVSRIGGENRYLLRERWASIFTLQQRELGNSNENRLELASQTAATAVRRPFIGVGVGNARYYLFAEGRYHVNHAENVYLQLLIEQGMLGLAVYLALLGMTCRRLKRGWLVGASPLMGSALTAVFVGLAVYGMFNNLVDNTWYWTVMALVVAQARLAPTRITLARGAHTLSARQPWAVPRPTLSALAGTERIHRKG
jgi:O-antigen ligase